MCSEDGCDGINFLVEVGIIMIIIMYLICTVFTHN